MEKYERVDTVTNKMRTNITECSVFKDSQCSNKIDLQEMLELLNTTNDVNLQIKLFSALSACLMFNKDANIDVIIKSRAVYDKIHNVLSKGLPRKATNALNFLSALLYVNAEENGTSNKRTLGLYARNMTRISGCLGAMTDMFANCMMFHDTWKALCQCLSIACSGCEFNQSYCTHIIPVCIQKCSQTNIDVFLVLQSLLLNHNRNLQLFLECNGTAIFTRELLHFDKSLQLLTTVVQTPAASSVLLRETTILNSLRDFLRLYGPRSQIGQKAMIILNHIESRLKGFNYNGSKNVNKGNETQPNKIDCSNNITQSKATNELDDTRTLMQNVVKEIFNYKQSELGHLKKAASQVEVSSLIRGTSAMNINSKSRQIRRGNTFNKTKTDHQRLNRLHCNIATELSFSFLQNGYKRRPNGNGNSHRNETTTKTRYNNMRSETNVENTKTQKLVNIEKDLSDHYKTISHGKPSPVDLKDFRPFFASTPKREEENSKEIYYTKVSTRKPNLTTQSRVLQQRTTKVQKRRPKTVPRNKDKDLRNRSLSSRFFSAINDSCTTLVKTVASIFKKKDTPDSSKESTRSLIEDQQNNGSCSFSFLNYMEKRDAVLSNKLLKKRNREFCDFSLDTKSCETCDDTKVLKQKLANDAHLKQTVKKLKLGINLYGCDFKKISRTMWPRESYMTPVVLYNLYRKLLLK